MKWKLYIIKRDGNSPNQNSVLLIYKTNTPSFFITERFTTLLTYHKLHNGLCEYFPHKRYSAMRRFEIPKEVINKYYYPLDVYKV